MQANSLGIGANGPVEITAQTGIDWNRADHTIVAHGGVEAKQGTATLTAQTLTARYSDANGMQIETLEAAGTVRLVDQGRVLTGDRALYNVTSGVVEVFGRPARLQDPQGSVTATQRMTYDSRQNRATAEGDAVATQGDRVLKAGRLVALFTTVQGKQTLDRIDAEGGVLITTPTETASANQGRYRAAEGIATLTGAVRITQGRNLLTGAAAEMNLNSGLARITTPNGNERVRVLFYPSSKPGAPGG